MTPLNLACQNVKDVVRRNHRELFTYIVKSNQGCFRVYALARVLNYTKFVDNPIHDVQQFREWIIENKELIDDLTPFYIL